MEGFSWPKYMDGSDKPVAFNETLGLFMCRNCWDGKHSRNNCPVPGCQCGCYVGRSKGLNSVHPPRNGCEIQTSLPEVGGFDLK